MILLGECNSIGEISIWRYSYYCYNAMNILLKMARPEGFEPPTAWFVGNYFTCDNSMIHKNVCVSDSPFRYTQTPLKAFNRRGTPAGYWG